MKQAKLIELGHMLEAWRPLTFLDNRPLRCRRADSFRNGADDSRSNNFQSLPFDTSVLSYQYRNNRHYEFFRNSECRSDKFYGSYSLLLLINAFLAKIYIFNRTLCHSRLKDSFQSFILHISPET